MEKSEIDQEALRKTSVKFYLKHWNSNFYDGDGKLKYFILIEKKY